MFLLVVVTQHKPGGGMEGFVFLPLKNIILILNGSPPFCCIVLAVHASTTS